jgi:hypothetical protein
MPASACLRLASAAGDAAVPAAAVGLSLSQRRSSFCAQTKHVMRLLPQAAAAFEKRCGGCVTMIMAWLQLVRMVWLQC